MEMDSTKPLLNVVAVERQCIDHSDNIKGKIDIISNPTFLGTKPFRAFLVQYTIIFILVEIKPDCGWLFQS